MNVSSNPSTHTGSHMPEESTSDVEVEVLAQPSQSPEEGAVFVLENASLEVAKVGKVGFTSKISCSVAL